MKLNEIKPVDQINFVVEVVETKNECFYLIRLSNGAIVRFCFEADEIGTFFSELEFPTAPASKL